MIEGEEFQFVIGEEQSGLRLDKALAELLPDVSRSRLKGLIDADALVLNGLPCKDASRKVAKGHTVSLTVPAPEEAEPEAEDIPLDIVFEDEHMLVINKPVGLVVHPGAGNYTGTLVNALLHHCKDELSGIGGVMRPGIVHRLDKDTSGLMVVAKTDQAHSGLAAQLEDRSLSRVYGALVVGVPVPMKGNIDMPIGRDPRNRLKMSIKGKNGKPAKTHYHIQKTFGSQFSFVECNLESGRTHQIRVHMQAIKHPLIGDPLYGPQDTAIRGAVKRADMAPEIAEKLINFPRQALHAGKIGFIHPVSGAEHRFEAALPDDFSKLLKLLD